MLGPYYKYTRRCSVKRSSKTLKQNPRKIPYSNFFSKVDHFNPLMPVGNKKVTHT